MKGDKTIPIAWAMVAAIALWILMLSVGPTMLKNFLQHVQKEPDPIYEVIR